jgi:hypothetical protein
MYNMRFFLIAILVITGGYNKCYCQHYKKLEVSFTSNNKTVNNVKYYYLSHDTARLFKNIGNAILVDSNLLKSKPITFLVLYEEDKIIFKPEEAFFYLKIELLQHRQNSKKYLIYYGGENELLLNPSNRSIVIAK